VATDVAGYTSDVSGIRREQSFEIECPHCRKSFAAEPIEGGRAARYLGFKCPHCKLFVPLQRAMDRGAAR
jgi:phage FluMu protein Com